MTDAYAKMIAQMLESGQEFMRAFEKQTGGATATEPFPDLAGMPAMPAGMLEMWLGKTFNRDGLDARTRLLLMIGGLLARGVEADAQLTLLIRNALESGASQREVAEAIWQMGLFSGLPAMQKALKIAQAVFDEHDKKDKDE